MGAGEIVMVVWVLAWLTIGAVLIAAMWQVFTKAGKPGWACLVPIYNAIVLLEIVGRPPWWIVLLFVPLANIVVSIIVALDLAKAFGKGSGFGVGLALLSPVFYPILGFGSARYQGPPNGAGAYGVIAHA